MIKSLHVNAQKHIYNARAPKKLLPLLCFCQKTLSIQKMFSDVSASQLVNELRELNKPLPKKLSLINLSDEVGI